MCGHQPWYQARYQPEGRAAQRPGLTLALITNPVHPPQLVSYIY